MLLIARNALKRVISVKNGLFKYQHTRQCQVDTVIIVNAIIHFILMLIFIME